MNDSAETLANLRGALNSLRAMGINPYDLVALDYLETARAAIDAPEASVRLRGGSPLAVAIDAWMYDDILIPNVIREVAQLSPERFL